VKIWRERDHTASMNNIREKKMFVTIVHIFKTSLGLKKHRKPIQLTKRITFKQEKELDIIIWHG